MESDLQVWLEAELVRVEGLARGAGSWTVTSGVLDSWVMTDDGRLMVAPSGMAEHVAAHDPDAVLRHIAADRALLADLKEERHEVVDGDCWYTCLAATEERDGGTSCRENGSADRRCDCGRDARVERRVRTIAEGWGWKAENLTAHTPEG
jgi:hypothetical protein